MTTPLFMALALGATPASATSVALPAPAEWVEFGSAAASPTPFALKRAEAQGIKLKANLGEPLRGLLVHPEGNGPFPAVVLLHGCDGIQPFQRLQGDQLAAQGYVALLPDSYGPRGIQGDCAAWRSESDVQPYDAFGALAYLRGLSFVDPARVAVLGWGTGGHAVLLAVDDKGARQLFGQQRFAAGVALYPTFTAVRRPSAPLLVLLGGADDCVPAAQVEHALGDVEPGPFTPRLEVLPDAAHGFDDPRYTEPVHRERTPYCLAWPAAEGATLAYSKTAQDIAAGQVRAFLEDHLKQR